MDLKMSDVIGKVSKTIGKLKLTYSILILMFILYLMRDISIFEVGYSKDAIENVSTVCIGSLSSILGILIAIYILSFSLFEKNFVEVAYYKMPGIDMFLNYFQLCFFSILNFIFVLLLLGNNISGLALNYFSLALLLFALAITLIVPLVISLIKESNSDKHIEEMLKSLKVVDAYEYLNPDEMTNYRKNPYYILTKTSRNFIDSNERLIVWNILNRTSELVENHILNKRGLPSDHKSLVNAYNNLSGSIARHAYENKVNWPLTMVIENYTLIRLAGIENNIEDNVFKEIDDVTHRISLRTLDIDIDSFAKEYIDTLFDSILLNIEYQLPSETELTVFNRNLKRSNKTTSDRIKWSYILRDLPRKIHDVSVKAIKCSNIDLINNVGMSFNHLFISLFNNDKVGNQQKTLLLNSYSYYWTDIIIKKISSNPEDKLLFLYDPMTISEYIVTQEPLALILFTEYVRVILELSKNDILGRFELSDFGALARLVSDKVNEIEGARTIVLRVMKVILAISNRVSDKYDIRNVTLQIELYEEAKSILSTCRKHCTYNDEFIQKVQSIFDYMQDVEEKKNLIDNDDNFIDLILSQ